MASSLSIWEQYELNLLAEDFITQVRHAIKTKLIRRRSTRDPDSRTFEAVANASGALAESAAPEFDDNALLVTIFAYVDNIIFGSPPGTMVEIVDIKNWMIVKQLNLNPKRIAENIYREGSSIWREHQGKDSGVFEDVNIDNSIEKLREKLATKYVSQVADEIFKNFNVAA